MLRTSAIDYELPPELIATRAAEPRDAARLLVVRRSSPGEEHRHVRDLGQYLRRGDLLVLNTTRVLPARLIGTREETGARVQGLYVRTVQEPGSGLPPPPPPHAMTWHVLLKMRRFRAGTRVVLTDQYGGDSGVRLRLRERVGEGAGGDDEPGGGGWVVGVENAEGGAVTGSTVEVLERVGRTPLPPYILAARKQETAGASSDVVTERNSAPGEGADAIEDAADRRRYQTVYADAAQGASVAAPTAGLHFTPELLRELEHAGVQIAHVVLHVGLGTFKSVETEFVEDHPMHAEWCRLPAATAGRIIATRREGGRVIAVGTTAARTIESFGAIESAEGDKEHETRLLITPGYQFQNIDGLMTNFHLPRSTLMAMVSALLETSEINGVDRLQGLYATAIERGYRFYSFGDAMLVLP